jgi:hypothetical protein
MCSAARRRSVPWSGTEAEEAGEAPVPESSSSWSETACGWESGGRRGGGKWGGSESDVVWDRASSFRLYRRGDTHAEQAVAVGGHGLDLQSQRRHLRRDGRQLHLARVGAGRAATLAVAVAAARACRRLLLLRRGRGREKEGEARWWWGGGA